MQKRINGFQQTLPEIEERKQRVEQWRREKEEAEAEKLRSQSAEEDAAGSGYEQLTPDLDQAAEAGSRTGD